MVTGAFVPAMHTGMKDLVLGTIKGNTGELPDMEMRRRTGFQVRKVVLVGINLQVTKVF